MTRKENKRQNTLIPMDVFYLLDKNLSDTNIRVDSLSLEYSNISFN